jgi:large subunit ribosomal protein L30
MAERMLVIKQTRSTNRRHSKQLRTLEALGLGRIGRVAEHKETPDIIGMLRKVRHLIEARESK